MAAIIEALSDGSTKLGHHGLTVNGKLFARFVEGTLVVRLPEDRIAELVAAGIGTRCDASRLRHWLKVTSSKASWIDLASQARAFARGDEVAPTAALAPSLKLGPAVVDAAKPRSRPRR
jgi:hypothetical protein